MVAGLSRDRTAKLDNAMNRVGRNCRKDLVWTVRMDITAWKGKGGKKTRHEVYAPSPRLIIKNNNTNDESPNIRTRYNNRNIIDI